MMRHVGPTTASAAPEILTIQYVSGGTCLQSKCAHTSRIYYKYCKRELFMITQFPNQTFIYTPSSAYVTYRYKTSPHQDRIVDFPEGKVGVYTKFFEFANFRLPLSQFLFDILGYYQIHLSQLSIIGAAKGVPDYCGLAYECSEGWDAGREYVFPKGCDNTEHTPYPNLETTRSTTLLSRVEPQILPERRGVKIGSRPRAAHEVPLLTVTANRVIEMEDPAAATDSSGVPSIIERSLLDFANENPSQQSTGPKDQVATAPEVPPPENVTTTGIAPEADPAERVAATGPFAIKEHWKSLAAIELGMGSTCPIHAPQGAPVDVSDPDPLSFADPQTRPSANVTQSSKGAAAAEDPESENTSFASMVGSSKSIYRPEWGITNGCLLDVPEACQDLVDHIAPPGGSPGQEDSGQKNEIKNLETLLEAEADMRKTAENKSAELSTELENMRALFSNLQVSNNRLSQQVSTLQEQVIGEEKIKAAVEEFKRYKDNRVEQHCAEMDALSINFDEELYPHMLTAIAGIAKGMSEGLKHRVEHGKAKLDLEAIEAYDPKAKAKYIAALHALKNLNSSHLTIPVYPEVCDPMDPWACKEEILLADVIAANISRAEKKKRYRVGLAILLVDVATQTDTSDEASPRFLMSSSLPVIRG
uniref:Transposase (Putative), gypsy type n=1 Tax=Tanacetum cinerariifolium TaxID=118510 RepID=A0A6L2JWT1_TANCI|nr:transposase (putative), gypsy type [Tanacetum cinerariifolium]